MGRWERHWGYRCVLTMPQIELMQADLPHTLYDTKKKGGEGTVVTDKVLRLTREANARRKARKSKEAANAADREYTLDEVFSGAADE